MQRHEAIMDMKYYFNILQRILIIWREGSKGGFGVKLIYFRDGYAKKLMHNFKHHQLSWAS